MNNLAEILEGGFGEAVEVKDRKALHRCMVILVESLAKKGEINKQRYEELISAIKEVQSDIEVLAEVMKKGFEDVNHRFEEQNQRIIKLREDMNNRIAELREDMNARFEDMHKRINFVQWLITGWMTILTAIIVILKFIK